MKMRRLFILSVLTVFFLFASACSSKSGNQSSNLVIVNAPNSGEVRRILATEGDIITQNTVIIEIVPLSNIPVANSNNSPNQNQTDTQTIQKEIKSAEEKLEQASVEVSRMETLVAANSAPQAQLDAARADFQKAQEKLDNLRRINKAPINSVIQPNKTIIQPPKIVTVPAPINGKLSVISVRVGQKIKAGQPIAVIAVE